MTSEVFENKDVDQNAQQNPEGQEEQNPTPQGETSSNQTDNGRPADEEKQSDTSGTPDSDVFKTGEVFSKYVGEGRKYKDAEELAKAKEHADTFIEHLKQETTEVKEELNKRLSAEEALSNAANEKAKEVPQGDTNSEPVDEARLAELVKKTMTEMEQSKTADSNLQEAGRLLSEATGSVENAQKKLSEVSEETGISVDELKSMGSKSPKALMKLAGLEGGASKKEGNSFSANTAKTSVNSEAYGANNTNRGDQPGTAEHFNKLRKEDPAKYFGKDTQLEILKAKINGTY